MLNMQNVKDIEITEGSVRTIHDKDNRLIWGRLTYDTKYDGDTIQDGTPTPDAPVNIQIVTGTQTVTVSDGVDSEDYTISLGSIELCKLGDYQDYIYKSGDDWLIHKVTGSVTYDGSESWNISTAVKRVTTPKPVGWATWGSSTSTYPDKGFCTHLLAGDTSASANDNVFNIGSTNVFIKALNYGTAETTTADWITWLSSNNITIYSILATPTDTQITDTTLISQLNAIHEFLTRYGYNSSVTGNLPLIINQTSL